MSEEQSQKLEFELMVDGLTIYNPRTESEYIIRNVNEDDIKRWKNNFDTTFPVFEDKWDVGTQSHYQKNWREPVETLDVTHEDLKEYAIVCKEKWEPTEG